MGVFITIAARNLAQAKRRTFLLALALAAVTALLVLLLGLSRGLTDTMIRSATTLSSGHVNVAGFFKTKPSDAQPIVTKTAELRRLVEGNVPGVDYVLDRVRGWARVISETSSLNTGLTGIDPAQESRLLASLRLAEEREYVEDGRAEVVGDLGQLARADAAVSVAAQAKRLGVRVGDTLTITVETTQGARNTGEFTVVAVAKDIGFLSNWSTFMNAAGVRQLYQLDEDVTGALQIYLEDVERSTEVMGHLRGVLEQHGYTLMEHEPQAFWMKFETVAAEDWTGQRLDLTIWRDEVSFLTWVLTAIDSVSFFLVAILMVIIAIGIMNAMWMSVRERTNEVGTLRAIGMSRRRVLLMFLLEALILGVFATSLGAVIGAATAAGLDAAHIAIPVEAVRAILMSDVLHLVVSWPQLAGAVLVFTGLAAAAALLPALAASRMQPVSAIQHVN